MTKQVLIILAQGFEEMEATISIDLLRRAKIEVTLAGLNEKIVQGSRLISLAADTLLSEVINQSFDAYILPGGMPGATNLANSDQVRNLIKTAYAQGKLICAICAAPAVVLPSLGILDNKTATCYPGMEKSFPKSAKFSSDQVVVDGNLITSQGPGTAFAFALKIIEVLAGKEISQRIAKGAIIF